MSTAPIGNIKPVVRDIPLQVASADIWRGKYRLQKKDGTPVDQTIEDTYKRVARALADVEETDQELWYERFLSALNRGAIPAGRIISNAGASDYKPSTSTINCTVSGVIRDSMDDILEKNKEAGLTLKAGCGIGYDFSTLRPKGSYVSGAGARTSGPLSFMDIFDKMCLTISSAGARRGAQMATFNVSHPDVLDFIRAKREDGRLRQFNLSLLITDEFMDAVKNDMDWRLFFPCDKRDTVDLDDPEKVLWRDWPIMEDNYIVNDKGLVACRIYRTIKARRLWRMIMLSTYDYAEPGFILIDRVNKMNNNWYCENIRSTNPCGEQPLPPYGSCLLGSVNLTKFVINPFTDQALFDWDEFRDVVKVFTRMLDNVVEINSLPLSRQRDEIIRKRRHGMGFLGLGSTLAMLCIRYGSEKAVAITEKISLEMAMTGWKTGLDLAREKGPAPIMEENFTITGKMVRERPEILDDGFKVGDKVKGKVLHAKYSNYMRRLAEINPFLVEEIKEVGARFTHHSSIAPTGTISLSLANNASNGIEPSFEHFYSRNVIRENKKTKDKVDVLSFELLAYRDLVNAKAKLDELPDYFVAAADITPKEHVDMQAAAQKWIDSSISKTANVPADFDFDKFKGIYEYAYDKGLKGCTTFRYNPEAFQGVLVREEDLKNTTYRFTLKDGKTVDLKGDERVMYDGEEHTAANLYDAIKEGYYGRY